MNEQQKTMVEARIKKYLHLIPEHMHKGVMNYVFDRIEPGSFLRAILENNLVRSAERADHINREALWEWSCFLVEALPVSAWGSEKRVQQWLAGGKE